MTPIHCNDKTFTAKYTKENQIAADFADEREIAEKNVCHEFARMNTKKTRGK
jgi:hypothetical protein